MLHTTLEPCPLCLGAWYMSGVRNLSFAARDPYAGSVNLIGATPYMRHKPVTVLAPSDPWIESAAALLFAVHLFEKRDNAILVAVQEVYPDAVRLAGEMNASGVVHRWRNEGAPAHCVFDALARCVAPVPEKEKQSV